MYWSALCNKIQVRYDLVKYVYLGTAEGTLGEKSTIELGFIPSFTVADASTIVKANGATFEFRGETYTLNNDYHGIFTYECPSKTIVYGKRSQYILIACGRVLGDQETTTRQCRKAIEFGLLLIRDVINEEFETDMER
ncbi:unnamed protein product [Clavelina lepadiformis]|uniref:Profilin n=1 Tax=Clavelina lepadiformis TaxID=159417 RepID=A0ABP0GXJ1_CLALP